MNPTTTTMDQQAKQPLADTKDNPQNTQATMPTLVERKQQELEEEICKIYREVAGQEPNASWHKQSVLVAAKVGMSPEGIKKLLERNGITNPNKKDSRL